MATKGRKKRATTPRGDMKVALKETAPSRSTTQAPEGQVFQASRWMDTSRSYYTEKLKPDTLKNLLRGGDSGQLCMVLEAFEEMEEKDAHLLSVASTRRQALTGLEWRITSAAEEQEDHPDKILADKAADFVRESLSNLESFDESLEHLSNAIGPNLAVVELVWEENELKRIVAVPSWRLTTDGQTTDVRMMVDETRTGVLLPAGKFVVYSPHNRTGFPFEKSLSRAVAQLHVIKHYAISEWALFVQLFGIPLRFARYQPSAKEDEKKEALAMLQRMGSAGYALFSQAVEFELKEASFSGAAPHQSLIEWCEKKQSIAFLGAHLMVDTANATGTHAAGSVQNAVREDLLKDDIRRESRMVRRQIIGPMCRFSFGRDDVPLPTFERHVPEVVDREAQARLINSTVHILGLEVDRDYAYNALGIPRPADGADVLRKRGGFEDQEGEPPLEEEEVPKDDTKDDQEDDE
ncbi:MAG: DUF935 family protein [Planctomycetota bacterium]